jgi:hypothetical protein
MTDERPEAGTSATIEREITDERAARMRSEEQEPGAALLPPWGDREELFWPFLDEA